MELTRLTTRLYGFAGLVLILISCERNSCEDISCFSPPTAFYFEITDKETGENLFANGTYTQGELEIRHANGNPVPFTFTVNGLVEVTSIGWVSESMNYVFTVPEAFSFSLYVEAERVTENCCSFTRFEAVEITGAAYSQDDALGVYKIRVE